MECVICTEVIQNSAALNCCAHSFCTGCILSWSKQSSTCPCCRKEIEFVIDSELKIHLVEHVKARTPSQDYIASSSIEDSDAPGSLEEFIVRDYLSSSSSQSSGSFSSSSSSRDESPIRIRIKTPTRRLRPRVQPLTLVQSRSPRGRAQDRAVSQRLARFC